MKLKKIVGVLAAIGITAPGVAMATNGMLMEGYGPIATSMGGASMAYDNGAASMANNPATLGMMPSGSRLDIAIGGLHPDITSTCKAPTCGAPMDIKAPSGGDAYYMPAAGWVKKDGKLAYGVGVFAQGGMGSEYGTTSWMSGGSGLPNRSEVGIGSLIVPLAYDVSPDLTIAGSVDFVWGGMDMQANMPGMHIDFSNSNDFSGKAHATGWAGKLGMTYKVNKQLALGATYHTETSLGDMEGSANATFFMPGPVPTSGTIKVVDFQFPETFGLGLAYQANDKLMIAADYKRINWSKTMKTVLLQYTTAGMGTMDIPFVQNWEDQDVFMLGVAYKATDALTLRAGVNVANNPVPDSTVNPLFPATIKDHYTLGAGYAFNKVSDVNFSYAYAPKVTVTAPATAMSPSYTIEHSQSNWQLMYSHRF
ncbi:MAG: outer membrane protein transport protein [Pseudomonadota bacterium]